MSGTPNLDAVLAFLSQPKNDLHCDAIAELATLTAAANERDALRKALEKIADLAPKKMPTLDEDADHDDCANYGISVGKYVTGKIARAALAGPAAGEWT